MNEVELRKRIEAVIKYEQLTAARFAEILGVQRSSISHILSGRNNPSLDFIVRITEKFEYLSLDWLIFGTGEMVKETEKKKSRQNDSVRDLFNVPINAAKAPEKLPEINTSVLADVVPVKKIVKILVFYSDNSFEEYKPC